MNLKKVITTGALLLATTAFNTAFASPDVEVETDVSPEIQATRKVDIPAADYFLPMVLNIRAGDTVRFVNNDEDPHTVTTDPVYSSGFYQGVNVVVRPKNNAAGPGAVRIRFSRPGTFTYFCRNHAHLVQGQPVNGGALGQGIVGRPMMGIIIVR